MRLKVLFVFIYLCSHSYAQLKSGFDAEEAKKMIQICNSFGYIDLYGSDADILPQGLWKQYTSSTLGMDNKFQIYANKQYGVIHFRGSTSKTTSWLENLYASMIAGKGEIIVNQNSFKYKVASNEESRVHAGYMLALYYLKDDLLKQIKKLNDKGIYNFYITGHSQGGALAQMTRAYLHYLPANELSKQNTFKVYAFANPMIGNNSFVKEYNQLFCEPGMSFLIHNPIDYVTKLPVSYNDSTYWQKYLSDFLFNRDNFSKSAFAIDGAMYFFKDKVNEYAKKMSKNIEAQIIRELGDIQMPKLYDDINYVHTGNIIKIAPVKYPLELKDSSILKNDSLMRIYKRNADGVFEDKSLYKKQEMFIQHKAYNYYVSLLKEYFPSDYDALKNKYFVLPKKGL